MSHSTTTSERIVQLELERQQLMSKLSSEDGGSAADRDRLKQIGRELIEKQWPLERAARVLATDGPPRLISDDRPMSYTRPVAYGIAPLPSGVKQ